MVSKIISGSLIGINGYVVTVEVDISNGLPAFEIVGLPGSAVKESKERVRSAIKNSNASFPTKKITVNLAPADTRKEGPFFDLPIAVGILSSMGVIEFDRIKNVFFVGELSLDAQLKPVRGILSMIHNAYMEGVKTFIVPLENAEEASLVEGANIIPAHSLCDLIEHFNDFKKLNCYTNENKCIDEHEKDFIHLDFSDVKGQSGVKRALEIACAGYHNIIMIGPPGSGKTMMAKRIPYIMPDLNFSESIEVTKIYSISGFLDKKNVLISKRPFRSPHHTISNSGMSGGGSIPKPGEISLAHKGLLFLDELPEFSRSSLEVMRQPLEDKTVTISRASGTYTFPADFLLVAAMNPCPCGNLFNGDKCTCSPTQVSKYLSKISTPLLDRIDIQIEASQINYDDLVYKNMDKGESSAEIKKRIIKALEIQKERYKDMNIIFNSQLQTSQIEKYCPIDEEGNRMLKRAFESMNLSVRAYHKILKVSRTIADLEGEENISPFHLSEAIQYRSLDRKYWG